MCQQDTRSTPVCNHQNWSFLLQIIQVPSCPHVQRQRTAHTFPGSNDTPATRIDECAPNCNKSFLTAGLSLQSLETVLNSPSNSYRSSAWFSAFLNGPDHFHRPAFVVVIVVELLMGFCGMEAKLLLLVLWPSDVCSSTSSLNLTFFFGGCSGWCSVKNSLLRNLYSLAEVDIDAHLPENPRTALLTLIHGLEFLATDTLVRVPVLRQLHSPYVNSSRQLLPCCRWWSLPFWNGSSSNCTLFTISLSLSRHQATSPMGYL